MKKFLLAFFLVCMGFPALGQEEDLISRRLNEEEMKTLLGDNPGKGNWAIPDKIFSWGITEFTDSKTGKIKGWEVRLGSFPEKTSERLWRSWNSILNIKGNNFQEIKNCATIWPTICKVAISKRAWVNPKDSEFKDFESFSFLGASQFELESPVEDYHLVWLYDLFETLKETPLGQQVFVDGVEIINWTNEDGDISGNWLLHDQEEEYPFDLKFKVNKNCIRKIQSAQITDNDDTASECLVFWGCNDDKYWQEVTVRFLSMDMAEVIFGFALPVGKR